MKLKIICIPIIMIMVVLFAIPLFSQLQGVILEEETVTPPIFGLSGSRSVTKTWISGDRIRRDEEAGNQTTIIRPDLGRIWMIHHSDTTYTEMTQELFQGLAMMGLMMFGVTTDTLTGKPIIPDPLFVHTGRTRMIGEWTCHEICTPKSEEGLLGMIQTFSMWISGDTGLDGAFYGNLMRKMMGDLGQDYDAFFDQLEQIEGYPVLLETTIMGTNISQELNKIEYGFIPDSVFELPAGYRKVDRY
ncbi:hypothetical protein JW824_12580 [bacterium]|nr:hypothetical protein [bacterium]RQV92110.1 MAG: hypothetical protein EH221_12590 [bacterium]